MNRLLRKSKFLFERRTVRIGISLAVLASVATGLVTVYYIRNSTYRYAQELRDNQRLSVSRGGFRTEEDYHLAFENDKGAAMDLRYLVAVHELATTHGLFSGHDPTKAEMAAFIAEASHVSTNIVAANIDEESSDRFAAEMVPVVRQMVDFANAMSVEQDLEAKTDVLRTASHIASTLDCKYSLSAYMNRVYATDSILNELKALQRSDVRPEQKAAVVKACVPILNRPFRTELMFKKEELRILGNFDIALGKRAATKDSINYRVPEAFPFWMKWVQKLPNVEDALRSRVYDAFNRPQYILKKVREISADKTKTLGDPGAMHYFIQNVQDNRASVDLIVHFSPGLMDSKNYGTMTHMQAKLWGFLYSNVQ